MVFETDNQYLYPLKNPLLTFLPDAPEKAKCCQIADLPMAKNREKRGPQGICDLIL